MLELFKKQGPAAYFAVGAGLLSIVGMILALISSGMQGYGITNIAWIVFATIVTIVLIVVAIALANRQGNTSICYLCLLVPTVLCGVCFFLILSARVYLIGTLLLTPIDANNPVAIRAMDTAVAGFAMYLIALIALVVSGFFNITRKNITRKS